MHKLNYLPKTAPAEIPFARQDSVTLKNFIFSPLDSTIATYKMRLLKNDWPFVTKGNATPINILLVRHNFIDSIAYDFVSSIIPWEKAERLAAISYLKQKNYDAFVNQMELLITQYPIVPDYYNMIANELLKLGKFNAVFGFLKHRYELQPDYFSTKWLGIIELSKNHVKPAIKYLEESIRFKSNDAQVLYNISGA